MKTSWLPLLGMEINVHFLLNGHFSTHTASRAARRDAGPDRRRRKASEERMCETISAHSQQPQLSHLMGRGEDVLAV